VISSIWGFLQKFCRYFHLVPCMLHIPSVSSSIWSFWYILYWNKFREELIAYFPLTRHRPP
jgi:hypothetical protein